MAVGSGAAGANASGTPDGGGGFVQTGVAIRVAQRLAVNPLEGSYLIDDLARDLQSLVAEAEPLVAEEAGFGPASPARARVLSRAEWASANVTSTVKLLSPLLDRVESRIPEAPESLGPGPPAFARKAYGSMVGVQLGGVLGIVSQRVLGQYELDEVNANDVWFVGPNLVLTERRFGFVPRDFRLWVAVHELTHRAQFEGNGWLRDYFFGLVRSLLEGLELQPLPLLQRLMNAARPAAPGEEPVPAAIRLLDPDQRRTFDRLQALMTVVEGHGNYIMDTVGARVIPSQPRMRATLQGSSWDTPLGKVFRRVLGLDMKRLQYDEGQRFFTAVAEASGQQGVTDTFASPEALPSLDELRSPQKWLARAGR